MRTIDMRPTWGEWGNIFYRIAWGGPGDALEKLHPDMAKAFAFAEALGVIWDTLSEEQALKAEAVMEAELQKQGVSNEELLTLMCKEKKQC